MGMRHSDPDARRAGQVPQAPRGGVPVRPESAVVEQERPGGPVGDRAVDCPPDCGRQRHESAQTA